jgi:Zn-dependent protease with chaperone function
MISFLIKKISNSWITSFICGSLATIAIIITTYLGLIVIFDLLIVKLPLETEEKIWQFIQKNYQIEEDDISDVLYEQHRVSLQALIDTLPQEVLPPRYKKIKLLIIADETINAFAAPGGRIILTSGLLDSLESENGLMFVIGHEIGHFINHDHLHECIRILSAGLFTSMINKVSSAAMDVMLMIDSKDARSREYQADFWGLKVVLAIYGHAGGIFEFFDIANNNEEFIEEISSHPSIKNRINAIKSIMKEYNIPEDSPNTLGKNVQLYSS